MTSSIVLFLAEPLDSPLETAIGRCLEVFGPEVEIASSRDETASVQEADTRPIQEFRFTQREQQFRVRASNAPLDPLPDLDDPAVTGDVFAAIKEHRASIAIEWESDGRDDQSEPTQFADVYAPIGRLAATFCDRPDTALWLTQWNRYAMVEDDTQVVLRSAQPILRFGVVHTRLGCLVREDSMWMSLIPTQWGPVEVAAVGGADGPRAGDTDRMAEIIWGHRLRVMRSRLMFSLLYRPYRVFLDAEREISVHFRNSITGSMSKCVSENDVPG